MAPHDVRSLEYVAQGHPDDAVRQMARLLIQHSDDPWTALERISDWWDRNAPCPHGDLCEMCLT